MEEYGETGAPCSWDGFLSRSVRELDLEEREAYAGRRILVTGAGGYLGSALARALSALPIAELILLDQAEYGLYRLEQELPRARKVVTVVGSVLDVKLLEDVFFCHGPHMVFHAAALKHVPLMEANPLAAAATNILGTQAVLEVAGRSRAERFVLLSTDKAVDPVSVMGATKRIAEQVVLSTWHNLGEQAGVRTVARLCNVLGSTGSVAPLFVRQIATGGPITLTHAEATRYFLSRSDAVQFLLRAGAGPTETCLLAPVLDRAWKVRELAEYLLGNLPGEAAAKARIVEVGLRAGDKLHEQIVSDTEAKELNATRDYLEVTTTFSEQGLTEALKGVQEAVQTRNVDKLLGTLRDAVPEFCAPTSVAGDEVNV